MVDGQTLRASPVWLYYASSDDWQGHDMEILSMMGWWGCSFSDIRNDDFGPATWLRYLGASELPLFELPQRIIGATLTGMDHQWCMNGNRVFFCLAKAVMERSER